MSDLPALHGGTKSVTHDFKWPVYDESDVEAVARVVRSGKWGDPECSGEVRQLEEEFAAYCGSRYALTCVNGSVSLRIALLASGVQAGDEVLVPPYTFYATASIVAEANCVPVFVDIHPETYCMDPVKIEAAITPRTRAIIPVHFAGQSCDMEAILAIAAKHNLTVIEDAAHAHGAEYKGQKLGSLGHAGSFSFQASKNMTSGEGGMMVTNDETLYDMMNSLRNCGRVKDGAWYQHVNLGCNYRMTVMQAALLRSQLKRLEDQACRRDENGRYLNELLGGVDGISPLPRGHGETLHSYHLYVFRYDAQHFGGNTKSDFVNMLVAEGVPASGGYPVPLHRQDVFLKKNYLTYRALEHVDYASVSCPVAEQACNEAVWITQDAFLASRETMEQIAAAVRKIQAYAGSHMVAK